MNHRQSFKIMCEQAVVAWPRLRGVLARARLSLTKKPYSVLLPEFPPSPVVNCVFLLKNQFIIKRNLPRAIKMSFGWSAGDIAECVKLLIKIGTALKDSGGSTDEYQCAVEFLKGVETTVQGVENIIQNHPDLPFQDAFQQNVTNLITSVTHFRDKTKGYDTSLGANATTSETKKTWKKIKLTLVGHIAELKLAISYPQSVLNNLLVVQAL